MTGKTWDVFISHATEDKEAVVRPLVKALQRAAVRVWYDEHELKLGDVLSQKIDQGLAQSTYGIVVLSPSFLSKHWPKKELSGLRALEAGGRKVILPIWHDLDRAAIAEYSPTLADTIAASTLDGITDVANRIVDAVFSPGSDAPSVLAPSVARRLIDLLASMPDKTRLVDFIRAHPCIDFYGSGHIEEYELFGTTFDAYATYAGHGLLLSLILFTDAWGSPFEEGRTDSVQILPSILEARAQISQVAARFAVNKKKQKEVKELLLSTKEKEFRKIFDLGRPSLAFDVYAGRREYIDRNADTHNVWSNLRSNIPGVSSNWRDRWIFTYDVLVENLLRKETPSQRNTL